MPSVVQPGGDGDSGGGAAARERPGRGRAAQRKPPGRRGTTRARTASSNRREPERVGTKAVPEVKPTRAASSTRRGATPAMAAATRARSASTCRSRATPAMTAAMRARAAASRRRGPPRGGGSHRGAPRGGRETEAKGRETEASGFPAEFAAEHFCPDAPGDEGEDDKMPPLNNPDPDSSDDEALGGEVLPQ